MRGIATLVGALLLSGVLCRPNEDQVAQTVAGNGQFARKMYSIISEEDGNLIFSPFSIHACLSMLYQGSTGAIHTDLEKALGVSHTTAALGYQQIIQDIVPPAQDTPSEIQSWQPPSDPVTIEVANKIYLDQTLQLKNDFKSVVQDKFFSEVEQVDFKKADQAAENINHWVEEKTRHRIKDLLAADDVENAALVLINAIYFKGAWTSPFLEENTKDDTFNLDAENEITVPMMEQTENFLYKEDADLDARIVELPYFSKDYKNQFSMIVVLPNKKDGIHELEQKLANKDINDLVTGAYRPEVHIKLPKFKIEQTIDLQESFGKLGLGSLFLPSQDLSGLIETNDNLYVSKAVHKAFIEVNEKGTEAAAATGFSIDALSGFIGMPPPPQEFHADHPFMFVLVHHPSQATYRDVLFYGRVNKPQLE